RHELEPRTTRDARGRAFFAGQDFETGRAVAKAVYSGVVDLVALEAAPRRRENLDVVSPCAQAPHRFTHPRYFRIVSRTRINRSQNQNAHKFLNYNMPPTG